MQRFPDWYIDSVKTPDGCVLRSNREMGDAFRANFRNRFARCTELLLQELRSYPAVFPHLGWLKRLVAWVWLLNVKSVMR